MSGGWVSAQDHFRQLDELADTRELEDRGRRLESVRRRVELVHGPQRKDDEPPAKPVSHEMELEKTHRPGWGTMYRAWCSCTWRARTSEYTPRKAVTAWDAHVRYAQTKEQAS